MDPQNFTYALIQVVHNFGAVAVAGGAVIGRWPAQLDEVQRLRLAWLILAGWAVQGISGTLFGVTSLYFYGQFPDIQGIAIAALLVKIGCVTSGFLVTTGYLLFSAKWQEESRSILWSLQILFAVVALTAAAYLRWFS